MRSAAGKPNSSTSGSISSQSPPPVEHISIRVGPPTKKEISSPQRDKLPHKIHAYKSHFTQFERKKKSHKFKVFTLVAIIEERTPIRMTLVNVSGGRELKIPRLSLLTFQDVIFYFYFFVPYPYPHPLSNIVTIIIIVISRAFEHVPMSYIKVNIRRSRYLIVSDQRSARLVRLIRAPIATITTPTHEFHIKLKSAIKGFSLLQV